LIQTLAKNLPPSPERSGGAAAADGTSGDETIAAISTPFGESGIGIVRVSGPRAESIGRAVFCGDQEPFSFISHHFHHGQLVDPGSGKVLDEVLAVLMRAPKTYTREDVLEIQCHGGYLVLQKGLEAILGQGARMALPGEFTRRAFLNGRIDLTRAEAVIDLIRAKTAEALEIAEQQLRGCLSNELCIVRERLVDRLALIEAHIDFPDEEIGSESAKVVEEDFRGIVGKLDEWILSFEEGRLYREGITCAIIGRANVGKSSLLNRLLRQERAIVTPFPGTTRDVIEEVLSIRGIPVRLMDTAGLRRTDDAVEQEGVRRTRERTGDADLVLLVVDGSREAENEDREIFREVEKRKKVVVLNKADLGERINRLDLQGIFPEDPVVSISALKGEGIEELKSAIHDSLVKGGVRCSPEHVVVANVRHRVALGRARERLVQAIEGVERGRPPEFVALDVRGSLEALAEMVGETTPEDVLNRIFNQFCIGK
jgi:tRNA modification GTPase